MSELKFIEPISYDEFRPIRDLVLERLREAILNKKLKPGDRIVESELAQALNVSRTPVREALRVLEAEGLLKRAPRKGLFVKGIMIEDVVEIYSIRIALETLAVSKAVNSISLPEINRLKSLVEQMKEYTDSRQSEKLFSVCQEFNDILIRACRMPRLIKLVKVYMEYLEDFRAISMAKHERQVAALKEHEDILQAVIDRDPQKAERAVRKHLQGALESFLKEEGLYEEHEADKKVVK
ncbi:transcriptional regulator, GntR family [Acetomicrobium flavidum]|uniref:Transcriptional regulator, GntR family n=1 Tax=Acetomicrobium flavidum TaxID=49896 RepID=A0ABY1JEW4_9BACT|nr:transcriptional regulator, GntR family [Acetomicrobium flavidum]